MIIVNFWILLYIAQKQLLAVHTYGKDMHITLLLQCGLTCYQ